jgi:hypothetical protein
VQKVGAFGDLDVSKCVRFEGVKGDAEDVVEGAIVRGSLYYILKRAALRVLQTIAQSSPRVSSDSTL